MRHLALALVVTCAPSLAFAQQVAPPTASVPGLQLSAIDRSADVCTDFYQFACGGWLARNPIPSDRPRWGRFDELQEKNFEILRSILERAAAGQAPEYRKIGDQYASCTNEAAIEQLGATPLAPRLEAIAAMKNMADLPALLGRLHAVGVDAFFRFGAEADFKDARIEIATLGQGGLGLPDRDYYFRDDVKSRDLRQQYVTHVSTMSTLAGTPAAQGADAASEVMRIETALAGGALDAVAQRDPDNVYHKMTMAGLQALTPHFDWTRYLRAAGAPAIQSVNVSEPEFLKAFDGILDAGALDDVKTYLRWQLVHASAPFLSSAFVNENFAFYGRTLQGTPELRARWKRCVQYTDVYLGEALGEAYVREAFGPQAKADMLNMVHAIEAALRRDITELPWMTQPTREQALGKLQAIENKIGYPDKWRDYRALEIARGDLVGNIERASAFEFRRQMAKIDKPVDKSEWLMTPPTVNAYYEPLQNNINFPAGILQPPFYSPKGDAALNYGGAGAVIGHELTHGFDDQGRQFDAQGNLRDWWTPADAKAFEDRAACFVEQYAGYEPVPGVHLNGMLTLGENAADNGGLRLALMAYLAGPARSAQTIDGFTPEQRVFLGWGQVWCENRRPEYERLQAQTNPHAPGRYRVNGVVSNMPEFQKAFSCRPQAAMVRENACRVW
ncbi:MAG: M13 family metallopeptidase [Acidobacteria bacterium]|nr:M13 family metallopeptidase [Acidobacteriota bacterium]